MPGDILRVAVSHEHDAVETRDSIKDIWGPRTGYNPRKNVEWPVRVDQHTSTEPDKWVQSACVMCSNGCGMDIGVKNGKIVGVRGRESDRVNKGRLGPKGLHSWVANHAEDRLRYPLIRNKEGKLVRATWDEAMDLIVRKSKDTMEKLGSHGMSFYTSGQLFLEEYYTLATIGKAGLGSLHMDGNTRLCTATAAAAMRESFGCDGQPGSYTDIDHCDCIFIVGHNIAATQTVLWSRILDRLAGPDPPKIVVMDPRSTSTAQAATVHIAPKIGTNVAVLNGLLRLLFEEVEGSIDDDYVKEHTVGVDRLRDTVANYPPERVEELSGVPAATLRAAAEAIGKSKRLLSTALQGVYQSNQATAAACQINNINLIRGMIGKEGAGVYQMNGQPTAQNNRETGCDGEFPGFRNHQNPQHMAELAEHWNIDVNKLPHWALPTPIMSILQHIDAGTVQFIWISGTNPAVSLPESDRVRRLLTKKELFVVAQDIFPTETTELADVVLPAAMWAEKTGCFTNVDRTVHISHKAIEPPGECKSDLDIWLDYAKRMDLRGKDESPLIHWTDPESAFEHWKKSTVGRPCDYSGMTYDLLSQGSGIQWPCNKGAPGGTERLYVGGHFPTEEDYTETFGHDLETGTPLSPAQYRTLNPNGRAILKASRYREPEETPNEEYPFRLSTGRRVYHFHTRTKTGRTKRLHDAMPENFVQLSQKDAEKLDLKDGDLVDVRSRRGAVRLAAKVGQIDDGQIFIPFHFGSIDNKGGAAQAGNELTKSGWDPVSFQPFFKAGAVKLTKVTAETSADNAPIEKFSAAIQEAEARGAPEDRPIDMENRARHLEPFLGLWDASAAELVGVFEELQRRMEPIYDMRTGIKLMRDMAVDAIEAMTPFVEKYHADELAGKRALVPMRRSLFMARSGHTNFDIIMDLHSLATIVASLLSLLGILKPVAGALLDGDFKNAVAHATSQLERIEQWAKYKAADKAPQSLLVPAKKEAGAWPWEAPVGDTVQAVGENVVDTAADLIQAAATRVGQVGAAVKSTVGL